MPKMKADWIRSSRLTPEGAPSQTVLFVTNMWPEETRPYYGSFIASQARSLCEAGFAVDVLYVRGFLGAQVYAWAAVQLPRLAQCKPYDLVHLHYGHTALVGAAIPSRPIVTSFCGEDLLGAPGRNGTTLKSQLEVAAFRQLARLSTVTITKSTEMAGVLPAAVRARNFVLPNGVDLMQFAPRSKEIARRELGWDQSEKVILFLGNPHDRRKNFGLARESAALVRQTLPDVRLHIGWGVPVELVPTLMNAADCLIFSSRSEGSPNAVKEAMACELPIVATPVGDIRERLDGVDNCYVRNPSPKVFSEALLRALERGRAPAARPAVESLSLGRVADRLIEIYGMAQAWSRG